MTKYKIQSGKLTLDVTEFTRDLQVIYREGVPQEIQVWRGASYYIDGELIKSIPPTCTRIILNPVRQEGMKEQPQIGENAFYAIGLSINQVLTILDVIASEHVTLPVNVIDGSLEQQSIPEGIDTTLASLTVKEQELNEAVNALIDQASQKSLLLETLEAKIAALEKDLSDRQDTANQILADLQVKVADQLAESERLEALVAQKQATVEVLDKSIADKSEESTRLAMIIEEQIKKVG